MSRPTIFGHYNQWALLIQYLFITLMTMDCSRATPAQVIQKMNPLLSYNEKRDGTLNSRFLFCNKLRNENIFCQSCVENKNSVNAKSWRPAIDNSKVLGLQSSLPWNKVPNINLPLAAEVLKESIEPRCAKRGLKDLIPMNPALSNLGLPGGSSKTRPAGLR